MVWKMAIVTSINYLNPTDFIQKIRDFLVASSILFGSLFVSEKESCGSLALPKHTLLEETSKSHFHGNTLRRDSATNKGKKC